MSEHESATNIKTSPTPRWTEDDRLLAEAVRAFEHEGQSIIGDPAAADAGRRAGDDLESRIIARAAALPNAPRLRIALDEGRRLIIGLAVLAMVIAGLTGAAGMRAALGGPGGEPTNVFVVLGGMLLLQSLLLVVWMGLLIVRPRAVTSGSIGGLVLACSRWLARRLRRDATHVAAATAIGRRWVASSTGVWTLSAISHGTWLWFNIGALVAGILLLTTTHYTFAWQTTIFSENPDALYVPLTQALGWLPERLGFVMPSAEQIRGSRWPGDPDAVAGARRAWSGLIIACITLYGLAPRLLFFALSLSLRRRSNARYRLDLESGYANRIRPLLMPESSHLGVIDPDRSERRRRRGVPDVRSAVDGPLIGTPAIIGYELENPGRTWPPTVHGVRWLDLGFVSTREDRHRVDAQLKAERPPVAVVVASLLTTPDRGVARFLRDVRAAVDRPVVLVLTAGDALRERASSVSVHHRLDDWHELASRAGLDAHAVAEIDLDRITDRSARRFSALLGAGPAPTSSRRLEDAFTTIVGHSQRWTAAPAHDDVHAMQVAIANHYRDEAASYRGALSQRHGAPSIDEVQRAASRMVDLLPMRLRVHPRWLGVGAIAGALGCTAAAVMFTPAAIAALPAWSGIGAAVTAVLHGGSSPAHAGNDGAASSDGMSIDVGQSVHAGVLFALVLEMQGDGDDLITRVLDDVFVDDDPPMLTNPDEVRAYLDACRHRYDVARAREAGDA